MTQQQLRALDAIERAQREQPHCRCGQPTRPVERAGAIWLECAALRGPEAARPAGPATMLRTVEHVRRPIVDLAA